MRVLLFFALFFILVKCNAQLILEGTAPDNYLMHKVLPKESWFSVGRMYNINARELATYNKIALEKGLVINQLIKVPIVKSNKYEAKVTLVQGENLIPIHHIVEKSEGLYKVANKFAITLQDLKLWNNLVNDNIITGSKLKVGFIKVKTGESTLVANAEQIKVVNKEIVNEPVIVKEKVIPSTENPNVQEMPKIVEPAKEKPLIKENNVDAKVEKQIF
jgi:LysM repeat protein